ncbi:HNH endonuclease [Candidatus Saccharibacteria bacterium]|nr:HNH endonuclease [Candidatus Saccharibacteria bacterium]
MTLERQSKFKTWLTKQGAIVLDPTNEYELVRFRTENGVSVVYTGKRGITFTGESEEAYERFKDGKSWKTVSRRRKQLRAKKARLAARDGKRCFAHGEKMNFDDLTIEHLLNFSHGGSDHESNLALVCKPCGTQLGNLPITKKIELMQKLRRNYLESLNV